MDGNTEAEQPLPLYPDSYHTLCENKTQHWPASWKGEFASTKYFYLVGFVDYVTDRWEVLNLTRLKSKLDDVMEQTNSNIPNGWLGITVSTDTDPKALSKMRAEKLEDFELQKFGRRRIERLRDGKSVSFYTALLAIACVRELMANDPDETRTLEEIFEIRWAGYMVHPWFSKFHENKTEQLMSQLCGFTSHLGYEDVFKEAAQGYPVTLPLAKRIQTFVKVVTKNAGEETPDLTIVKITHRTFASRRVRSRILMRPVEDEQVLKEWPAPDSVVQSAK